MADEVDLINLDSDVHYFTITNQAINRGTWVVLSDPRTVTPHSSAAQIVVGVTVSEVTAGDGSTRVGVRSRGIVDAVASGAITAGDLVELSGTANRVRTHTVVSLSHSSLRSIVGRALETASDAERIHVKLMLM